MPLHEFEDVRVGAVEVLDAVLLGDADRFLFNLFQLRFRAVLDGMVDHVFLQLLLEPRPVRKSLPVRFLLRAHLQQNFLLSSEAAD